MQWVPVGAGRGMVILAAVGMIGCGSAMHQAPPGSGEDSVSVGFAKERRASVATRIASVTRAEVKQSHMTRVSDMLRRVPGLEIYERANGQLLVQVAGMRGEPLFVMNGSPLPRELGVSALTGLVPDDVLRIDVLKDADAAIWGMEGGNGVIVIETKHSPR